jgi:hypothetical protein
MKKYLLLGYILIGLGIVGLQLSAKMQTQSQGQQQTQSEFQNLKVDTIVHKGIYDSYFSFKTKTPVFVTYILFHGGGNCKRNGMVFKGEKGKTFTDAEYKGSGFDIGHMADAKDFAFDCDKELTTFSYYNAIPQTPNCNRGDWKSLEERIRNYSTNDSILIICGGYGYKVVGKLNASDYCFKIFKNLRTKVITAHVFTNINNSTDDVVDYNVLITSLPFDISVKDKIKELLNPKK